MVHKKNHELGCQPEEHHCPEYVPHNTETETFPSILLVTTVYNLSAFWGLILSGTQLHDPIKLRTDPMAVLALKKWTSWQKTGGIPRVSTSVENGAAEQVRRAKILRRELEKENIDFPLSAYHKEDRQPYPVYPYSLLKVMTINITYYTLISFPKYI